jgi:hypothetical protein
MRPQRLTVGHRELRNPRCGFELINVAAVGGLLTVTLRPALRHGRACPGHPRLGVSTKLDVDARHRAGHDERDFFAA